MVQKPPSHLLMKKL